MKRYLRLAAWCLGLALAVTACGRAGRIVLPEAAEVTAIRVTAGDAVTLHTDRDWIGEFLQQAAEAVSTGMESVQDAPDQTGAVKVERDGKEQTIHIDPDYKTYLFGFGYSSDEKVKPTVSDVTDKGAFQKAGIKANDVILSVNGTRVSNCEELTKAMETAKTGKEVTFEVDRKGKEMTFKVTPTPYEGKTLGFVAGKDEMKGPGAVLKYSVIEVKYWIETTVASLGQLVRGKVSRNDVSGVVGIVDAVGGVIDQSVEYGVKAVIINMLYMSVLLSANLGVMNLLPLPALDGGRLVFILIEAVRGKPVDREKEGFVHVIGFFLLMILMVLIMFNDIWKIIH